MISWVNNASLFYDRSFEKVLTKVDEERKTKTILSRSSHVFCALALTPLDKVKVIILGQDPYPNSTHAMGLMFSVPSCVRPLPKSLQNIFKELKNDLGVDRYSGDLTDWAEQGVLLLNTSLTVVKGQRNSYANIGWKPLVNQVIKAVSDTRDHNVFILWGNNAHKKTHLIDQDNYLVITSSHPSPPFLGFFGNKPFSRTNSYLEKHRIVPIDR